MYRAIVLSLLLAGSASAEELMRCGGSSGYAHAPPSPLLPQDQQGWHDDSFAGEIVLLHDEEGFDVVFRDQQGRRSSREDGAAVVPVSDGQNGHLLIMVVYPGRTVENYMFSPAGNGAGVVSWGTFRAVGVLPRTTLMSAPCRPVR